MGTQDTLVIDEPTDIKIFQLKVVISAIKLEMVGLRHSKIRSVKALWANKLGLSPRAKPQDVIQRLQEQINVLTSTGVRKSREEVVLNS